MTSDIDIQHAEFSYSLRVNLRVRAGFKVQCHMWKIVAKVVGVTLSDCFPAYSRN